MTESNIFLKRTDFTPLSTIGELWIDSLLHCYSLEDAIRAHKIAGVTAIPEGRYEVIINKSARFGIELPLLLNVPGFTGIRIHTGNTAEDSSGCIILGKRKEKDMLYDSKLALAQLFPVLREKLSKGKLYITIGGTNGLPVQDSGQVQSSEAGPGEAGRV